MIMSAKVCKLIIYVNIICIYNILFCVSFNISIIPTFNHPFLEEKYEINPNIEIHLSPIVLRKSVVNTLII